MFRTRCFALCLSLFVRWFLFNLLLLRCNNVFLLLLKLYSFILFLMAFSFSYYISFSRSFFFKVLKCDSVRIPGPLLSVRAFHLLVIVVIIVFFFVFFLYKFNLIKQIFFFLLFFLSLFVLVAHFSNTKNISKRTKANTYLSAFVRLSSYFF
jgi:hypothetical protein